MLFNLFCRLDSEKDLVIERQKLLDELDKEVKIVAIYEQDAIFLNKINRNLKVLNII
jgi:hypothetical protein